MASDPESKSCCAENLADYQPSASPGVPTAVQAPEPVHQQHDFVEEPQQEYFCPVTFELLSDPKQTSCCGHHLSGEVVSRLLHEGKSCPLCNEPNFVVTDDKYFKRKTNELKVRCPHKRNGCEWMGELGNLDLHSNSCPKRPWQCKLCDFEGTYDVGTSDHLDNCTKQAEPCPNQCEIGTVPRCDMEEHLTQCPLQLVECEFAQAGCQVRVPRQDLARHMEEWGQRHLLSMSLLNFSLTRELHQKMAEKDQQIADLQEQLQQQNSKLEKQIQDLQEQTEKQLQTQLEDNLQKQATQMARVQEQQKETEKQISGLQTQLQNESKTLQQQVRVQGEQIQDSVCLLTGFRPPFRMTLTKFNVHRAGGRRGSWYSDPFYSQTGGYKFSLAIDTNGHLSASGTHISAYLHSMLGEYDGDLAWPIQITAHLQLLNQRGDHGHVVQSLKCSKVAKGPGPREIAQKFIAQSALGYNAAKNTEYLKDDCLHFRLYLKLEPQK